MIKNKLLILKSKWDHDFEKLGHRIDFCREHNLLLEEIKYKALYDQLRRKINELQDVIDEEVKE
jgi:hypothetical protein